MAAREFHLVLVNQWDSPLIWSEDKVDDGEWQDPWYPSQVPGAGHIDPSKEGEWRSESNGILTGTSGWAHWGIRVLDVSDGDHFEYIEVKWDLDYFNDGNGSTHSWASVSRTNPKGSQDPFSAPKPDPRPPLLEIVPARRDADGNARAVSDGYQPAISELGAYGALLPWSWFADSAFQNSMEHPRVDWILRRRGSIKQATSVEPSTDKSHGVIYFVDPVIEATFHAVGHATPASGGNLKWARHVGREHGSFQWEGPNKVGNGWAGFKQLFSAGGGIIYGVTPVVPATLASGIGPGMRGTPASGGDLMWYHHLGWDDGGFRWSGPKKVGTGWGDFKHMFSGGDGIIYGVTPVVPATDGVTSIVSATSPTETRPSMKGRPASGGDLMWYRHIGRNDGSFRWEGPKKVGVGWGDLKHVFPSGDGIIYAVTSVVPATSPTGTGPGMGGRPASGGDLLWFRHAGHDDGTFRWEGPRKVGTGWGAFEQVFAGSDGVIYAVTESGDLLWYRHEGRADGSFRWAANGGKKVGSGWKVDAVFSA